MISWLFLLGVLLPLAPLLQLADRRLGAPEPRRVPIDSADRLRRPLR